MSKLVTFDARQVIDLAGKVDAAFDPVRINRALVQAVNAATSAFDTKARRAMNAGIALDDAYISSRMEREDATSTPSASITAMGPGRPNRRGLTILGHYSPEIITTGAGQRAKGDAKRGIPAGQKAAGVRVTVTRGSPKAITKAFTLTLRRGTVAGDQVGVFTRTDSGKLKHHYGVSPYSLFRFQATTREDELRNDLAAKAAAALDEAINL